jgi:hypothetical protein
MKKLIILLLIIYLVSISSNLLAQGVSNPLTIQGLESFNYSGAISKSLGGCNVTNNNDLTSIFSNSANLVNISSLELKVGGGYFATQYNQSQQWIPDKLYAEISLIFQNEQTFKTKPYDNIKPGWSKKNSGFSPSIIALVYPFKFEETKIAVGFGFSEIIKLDHYYQNNNALSPNIGQTRPYPIPRLNSGDSLRVQWYQYSNQREGKICGYTPAISISLLENLSVGFAVTFLNGKSDDFENRNDRGLFRLYYNNFFKLDSVYFSQQMIGTSNYKGTGLSFSFSYRSDYFSFGATIRPSMTLTRDWHTQIRTTDTSGIITKNISGQDKIKYPLNSTLGIALYPSSNVSISFDYDIKSLNRAEYSNLGKNIQPWLSNNNFKTGIEYRLSKLLTLRGGYRDEVQVFAGEGAGLMNEPVHGNIYSFGTGIYWNKFSLDAAYEFINLSYEDAWLSNINFNKKSQHNLTFEVGYKF